MPVRPSPERVAKLAALGKLHDEFVAENAAAAGFEPDGRKPGSDYNVHHVDLDADPAALDAFHAKASALLGRAS
jgi:hypothetical protein